MNRRVVHAPQLTNRGLGTVVKSVAQPVAKAIDRVFKTGLSTCSGCAAREAKLNEAIPDVLRPFRRDTKDAKP